ncbi:glycosyltransferase family 4 protein [Pseudopelagicola sp. nBUS_19]|uniref:glycosyltransferase family 4 protein n=1 Tax=Pseudopelagicola sp. nBUS_19 TaxID=3395316 RepID=UPI003EB86FF7
MIRVAFYAPLKAPTHAVPSGEREMARNLIAALQSAGCQVDLVSEFRSLEKTGQIDVQDALIRKSNLEARALVQRAGWDIWVTYHSYYKAPDLIGPTVCAELEIPYTVIEATRASKRLSGPWAAFERRAQAVCDQADVLFYVTERDAVSLREHLRADQRLVHLPPFLPWKNLPEKAPSHRDPIILIVGMMRNGDKLASYRIASEALQYIAEGSWRVEIVGDGPARQEIEQLLAPLGAKVSFLGQLDREAVLAAYDRARAFLWPGVNEAFGMVFLEAQAAGVPVVAENRLGLCDVVSSDGMFSQGNVEALANELTLLLNDPKHHARRSRLARKKIEANHLIGVARETLWGALRPLVTEGK